MLQSEHAEYWTVLRWCRSLTEACVVSPVLQYAKLALSLPVPGGGKKKRAAASGDTGAAPPEEEEDEYAGGLC